MGIFDLIMFKVICLKAPLTRKRVDVEQQGLKGVLVVHISCSVALVLFKVIWRLFSALSQR